MGDSIEQVIKERNIKYPITENSMSLIFGIPVQTMLAKDVFDEGIHIDLYSFFTINLLSLVFLLNLIILKKHTMK